MRAGVDDFGSGTFTGFSCIVLSHAGARELEARGRSILSGAGMTEFHGKNFDPAHAVHYEDFVDVIHGVLEAHGESAAFQLVHRTVFQQIFESFAERLGDAVLTKLRGAPNAFVSEKLGAMMALVRVLHGLSGRGLPAVTVEMDWGAPADVAASIEPLALAGQHAAILTDASDAAVRLANAYRTQIAPHSPSIERLAVCDSRNSLVVQAADVVANFGINYVKSQLRASGASSHRESTKAAIFARLLPSASSFTSAPGLFVTADNNLDGTPDDNLRFELTLE